MGDHLVRRLKWQYGRSLGVVALTAQLRGPELTLPPEDSTTDQDQQAHDQESAHKKQKLLENESASNTTSTLDGTKPSAENSDVFLMLDVLPANMAAGTRSMARPLHVGDLRLADLRKIMQAAGHKAEFRGEGTLLIDGLVAVRESGTGRIEIEAAAQSAAATAAGNNRSQMMRQGATGESFLAVKRKIYEGLAVVSGS